MDPITMMAIQAGISAAPSILQGIQGARQNKQANDMLANIERPTFNIPSAATESLGISRNLASSFQMPGQAQAEQALNQQFAGTANNAINTASSSAEALAALVGANANRMNAQTNLAGQAEQSYMNRQMNLQNNLASYANWQQQAWDWNMRDKFLTDSATASAMKQAGQTNMFNALSNVAGVGANFIGGVQQQKNFDALLGTLGSGQPSMASVLRPSDPIAGDAPENPTMVNSSVSGGLAAQAAARNAPLVPSNRNYNIKSAEALSQELAKYASIYNTLPYMQGVGFNPPQPTLMPSYPTLNPTYNVPFGAFNF